VIAHNPAKAEKSLLILIAGANRYIEEVQCSRGGFRPERLRHAPEGRLNR
jgi:hypothetical protein